MAATGPKGFKKDLRKLSEKQDINIDVLLKNIVFDVFDGVVSNTPVDTGRARGSWNIGIGAIDPKVLPAKKKGARPYPLQTAYRRNFGRAAGMNQNTVAYISNSLPYIIYLEEGTSDQAPAGMVKLTLQELKIALERL